MSHDLRSSEAESISWGFLKALHPEDRDRYPTQQQHAVNRGQPYQISYRVRGAEGNYHWWLEQATPLRGDDGEIQDWIVTCTPNQNELETANQLKDELLLREQLARAQAEAAQQRFADLVNGLVDAIVWERDAVTGEFLFVCQSAENILGYPVEQWLKNFEFWSSIIHPDDREWAVNFSIDAISQGRNYELEYRCIGADSQVVWLRDRSYRVRDHAGEQKLRGLMIDITQSKQVEQELRESEARFRSMAEELTYLTAVLAQTNVVLEKRNQELDQFAYVTSHDLKAPLRAIANLSEWIEEDLADHLTEDTRHQMNLLRGRVHRMENLIEGLLQYSRVGRFDTTKSMVSVASLLAEVIDSLAPPESFTIEIAPDMPTFVTERLPLSQVFTNLISNALKHHPRIDGKIAISVHNQKSFYEFAIADDGAGIAPQYHEKVFGIFQTLEARDKSENTGIGLAIVKKIVERQGGTISLESQQGQGATFRFTWKK